MAKRIRRVSDLPNWFDLTKYAAADLLNTVGWYEQLSLRRHLRQIVDSYLANIQQKGSPGEIGGQLRQVLTLVRKAPIVDVTQSQLLKAYFYGGALHELKTRDPLYSHGVHLATVRDIYLTERNIDKKKRDYAGKFFDQIFGDNVDLKRLLKYTHKDWIDEPVDNIIESAGIELNVRVNMSVSDSVLIDRFRRMLLSARAKMRNKEFSGDSNWRRPDYSNWVQFGVLPFIDLLIWQREADVSIPNRVMADAIFAPGERGEETVRKTTSKLAFELLSQQYLRALSALGAYEISEQMTD